MNYAKPAIVLIDAAKSAIQGVPKAISTTDNPLMPLDHSQTSAAYEADE